MGESGRTYFFYLLNSFYDCTVRIWKYFMVNELCYMWRIEDPPRILVLCGVIILHEVLTMDKLQEGIKL